MTSSFLLLVARPGATSSILAPSSDALVTRCAQKLGGADRSVGAARSWPYY